MATLGNLSKIGSKEQCDFRRFKAILGDLRRLEATLFHSTDKNLNLVTVSRHELEAYQQNVL